MWLLSKAARIALRDPNVDGNPVLAIKDVESIEEASDEQLSLITERVFGTTDAEHGVATFRALGRHVVAGPIQNPRFSYFQADFPDTFRTAVEIREDQRERLGKGGGVSNAKPHASCARRTLSNGSARDWR